MLVERWNGHRFTRQQAPTPAGAKAVKVSGVACPTARSCVLVGPTERAGTRVALIETYS